MPRGFGRARVWVVRGGDQPVGWRSEIRPAASSMFSILHLSDLHRSAAEPISNDTLIASLQADCDRFPMETPEIRQPDAMVVSGDIVFGASLGESNFGMAIKEQYKLAEEFLVGLTERLFEGDRTRVAMVPGNHDCCWNTAFSGMRRVGEDEEPKDLISALECANSSLRWSWRERTLYRISEPDVYARRLDSYWDFVERFYSGCELRFPIQRNAGYNLFELDGGRILVAAFESLQRNDCFSYQGNIDPSAIAKAALRIRDEGGHYSLRVAVWHHGLHSEPSYRSDYVPINSVYDLIGYGFQLGLHGHQHFAEIGSHYIHIPDDRKMAIVSAGSLCAGTKDLPRGINRQYNVVVVSDDYSEAKVHVREVMRGNHFAASAVASGFPNGAARMHLTEAATVGNREVEMERERRNKLIIEAEKRLQAGHSEAALEILDGVDWQDEPYGRSLMIQAAERSEHWDKLAVALGDPKTANERIKLIEALSRVGRMDEALVKLHDPGGPPLAEHVRREMRNRLERQAEIDGRQG